MKLRALCFSFYFLALLMVTTRVTAKDTSPDSNRPAIRSFDTETLARLGREIYQHDQLAWKATDVMFAEVGEARMKKDGFRGWIVETAEGEEPTVRFLRSGNNSDEVGCDVVFPAVGSPRLKVPADRKLPAKQAAKAGALEAARRRFASGQFPWCGGNPNTVVLDDPTGPGFLVYFLRAKPTDAEVPIGGHYRFSVSADGNTVTQVDRLFASCLTMKKDDLPAGSTMAALVMSHVISPTPLETHVFLSLQEKLPFAVITPDGTIWSVEQGHIAKTGHMEDGKMVMPGK